MSGRERAGSTGAGGVPEAQREVLLEDERSADDSDRGWGEEGAGRDDDRFLRERPPHWE